MDYSEGGSVYVYSHWGGEDDFNRSPLAEQVREALSKRERWDDESYLARMIVSEIIKENDIDGSTGVGIAPDPKYLDEEYPRIVVDFGKQTVNDIPFDKWVGLYAEPN